MIEYLESLSTRAYYILYGTQQNLFQRLGRFFSFDWPKAAKALGTETIAAALIMLLGAIVGYVLVQSNPEWYFSFMPEGLSGGRSPASSTEQLRDTLYHDGDEDGLAVFATFLFSHNSRVAIFAFARVFAFCIPAAIRLLYTGWIL